MSPDPYETVILIQDWQIVGIHQIGSISQDIAIALNLSNITVIVVEHITPGLVPKDKFHPAFQINVELAY